jgi:hypothetical protein
MVRPDTVRENPDRCTLVRLDDAALERLKAGRLAEHVHRAEGSVQDVVHKPRSGYPRWSWHVANS